MKKLTAISLFIFWAAVTAVLTAGLIFYQNNNIAAVSPPGATPATSQLASASGNIILNAAEVARHNSLHDCWLIINNKIYNVTNYLSAHPGGVNTISPYCGQEATNAFDTKDIGQPHSAYAEQLLAQYYIGDLNQTILVQRVQNSVQQTNAVAPPPGGGGEREFDDD
jgi:cytochrome b involved in lipid metabolism